MRFCSRCNAPVDLETQRFCAECGAALKEERDGVIYDNTIDYEPSMRWFKFLIYFALFADAVINLILAGVYFYSVFLTGNIGPAVVYAVFGLLCVGFSAFAVYTRFRLAGFKKNAPLCVFILYAVPGAIKLLQILLCMVLSMYSTLFIHAFTLIFYLVLLIGNYVYFKRRKYKFIN